MDPIPAVVILDPIALAPKRSLHFSHKFCDLIFVVQDFSLSKNQKFWEKRFLALGPSAMGSI